MVAGPGSGKTRVLTARAAHLILAGGAQPWQLMCITFTNKVGDMCVAGPVHTRISTPVRLRGGYKKMAARIQNDGLESKMMGSNSDQACALSA